MLDSSKFKHLEFQKGQYIFREGDQGLCAYVIKEGAVNIFRIIDNQKIVLTTLGKNSIFCEMGVITAEPRTASAEAVQYTVLLEVNEAQLEVALKQGSVIVKAVCQQLIKRLREKDKLIGPRNSSNMLLSMCHFDQTDGGSRQSGSQLHQPLQTRHEHVQRHHHGDQFHSVLSQQEKKYRDFRASAQTHHNLQYGKLL